MEEVKTIDKISSLCSVLYAIQLRIKDSINEPTKDTLEAETLIKLRELIKSL